jgi:hypothetical protein
MLHLPPAVPHHRLPKANRQGFIVERKRPSCLATERAPASWLTQGKGFDPTKVPELQKVASPRVLMAVEDAVKVEPLGEFELKGIRRPLAAYNVVGVGSSARN